MSKFSVTDEELDLVNELLQGESAMGAFQIGYAHSMAMLNRLHVTRELLVSAAGARNVTATKRLVDEWIERKRKERLHVSNVPR